MSHLVAVVGIVFVGAMLLGERTSGLQGLGIFLIIGGVTYASLRGATRPAQTERPAGEQGNADSNPRAVGSDA